MNDAVDAVDALALPPAHEVDPGRGWRRLVMLGAASSILVTAMRHIDHPGAFWDEIVQSIEQAAAPIAPSIVHMLGKPNVYFLIPITCLALAHMLLGPVALFAAWAGLRSSPKDEQFCPLLLALLSFFALLTLFFFGLAQAGGFGSEWMRTVITGSLMAILLSGCLFLLQGWNRRGKPTQCFWFGIPVIGLCAIACFSLFIGEFLIWQNPRTRAFISSNYLLYGICDFVSTGFLLVGWLFWWRAVAKYERAQAAAPPPQSPPAA